MNQEEIKKYNEVIEKLQNKEYRLTDIRKAIIKILVTEKDISINDIIAKLKKTNEVINTMSVYNTIDWLMKEHIIHASIFEDKQVHYELSDNIIHIICNICHKIIHCEKDEIDEASFLNLKKLSSFLEEKKDFIFSHYILEIHGICSNCQKQLKNV